MNCSPKRDIKVNKESVQPLFAEQVPNPAFLEANEKFRNEILSFRASELLSECK